MIITQAPLKYVQGPDVMKEFGTLVKSIGSHFIVLASKTPLSLLKDAVAKSFAEAGVTAEFVKFGGEITHAEYNRVAGIARDSEVKVDAIIGMGGGKTLDCAKAVANVVGLPVITAPTIASNDAPCSSLSVIYSEEGHVVDVEFYANNPYLVVADSTVIANAPARMLRAGIGDALATYFEARVCYDNNFGNCLGSNISNAAFALAKICNDVLIQDGVAAMESVEANRVDKPLENIIESNSYLSSLGFESGGLSCAHSIQDALTTIPECHDNTMHGERVAYGTLCLLQQEGDESVLRDVMGFCTAVGLPVTLEQLYITEDVESKVKGFMEVAYTTEPSVYHMPPGTTSESLYNAIIETDRIGREFLAK